MYDARQGKFLSSDPLGLEAGDSNFYRYVGNDPVATTDPSGMAPDSPTSTCPLTSGECQKPDLNQLLEDATKELGLAEKADLLSVPFAKIKTLWQEAGTRGECCKLDLRPDAPWAAACRIKVPLCDGRFQHLWVVMVPPTMLGGAKFHIVGSDDGSAESFEATCDALRQEATQTIHRTFRDRFLNLIPGYATGKNVCEGEYGNAALSALGDAALFLGGAGIFFKSANVLRAAGAVAAAGAAAHGGRGLYNLYEGNYDDAAMDTLVALLFLWGAKTALKDATTIARKSAGNGTCGTAQPNKDICPAGTRDGYAPTNTPRKFWTKSKTFKGIKVFQRDDLIDPKLIDSRGRTNLERMQKGLAPIGPDGESINLHHLIQTQDGAVAEVTQSFHQQNCGTLHINPNTVPSGIDRSAFNAWKREYWMDRANDFRGSP